MALLKEKLNHFEKKDENMVDNHDKNNESSIFKSDDTYNNLSMKHNKSDRSIFLKFNKK